MLYVLINSAANWKLASHPSRPFWPLKTLTPNHPLTPWIGSSTTQAILWVFNLQQFIATLHLSLPRLKSGLHFQNFVHLPSVFLTIVSTRFLIHECLYFKNNFNEINMKMPIVQIQQLQQLSLMQLSGCHQRTWIEKPEQNETTINKEIIIN